MTLSLYWETFVSWLCRSWDRWDRWDRWSSRALLDSAIRFRVTICCRRCLERSMNSTKRRWSDRGVRTVKSGTNSPSLSSDGVEQEGSSLERGEPGRQGTHTAAHTNLTCKTGYFCLKIKIWNYTVCVPIVIVQCSGSTYSISYKHLLICTCMQWSGDPYQPSLVWLIKVCRIFMSIKLISMANLWLKELFFLCLHCRVICCHG